MINQLFIDYIDVIGDKVMEESVKESLKLVRREVVDKTKDIRIIKELDVDSQSTPSLVTTSS